MKYLRKFKALQEYNAYIKKESADFPNVSLLVDNIEVKYSIEAPVSYSVGFTADASQTIKLTATGASLEYSYDDATWNEWTNITTALPFGTSEQETIYLRGKNVTGFNTTSIYRVFQFGTSAPVSVNGNIMALIDWETLPNEIPNTGCFYNLFSGATALQSVNKSFLPATTLGVSCYRNMFYRCTYLKNAPDLPAQTLKDYCYSSMFQQCQSLESAPILPATTMLPSCYAYMFAQCKKLKAAPSLPATTLATSCYNSMFLESAIQSAPAILPATTLSPSCYYYMFFSCSGLTSAPELPATTLLVSCYEQMFYGCRNLKKAPVLPAEKLVSRCYFKMFYTCYNLNEIHCNATSITATNCTSYWVSNVASTGTFYGKPGVAWTIGENGIPSGWINDSTPAVSMTASASQTITAPAGKTFQYSFNKQTWSSMTTAVEFGTTEHPTIFLRGENSSGINDKFTFGNSTAKVSIGGNVLALLDYSASTTTVPSYGFKNLFSGATAIESVSKDFLSAATSLGDRCCETMFVSCTSLKTAPELPATTIGEYCYNQMFLGCTSMEDAPSILPATTLATACYSMMFTNCSKIKSSPELPALTLANFSYCQMFYGCSSLNEIHCNATAITAASCTNSWVYGVASAGTFYGDESASWTEGNKGIPTGWVKHLKRKNYVSFTANGAQTVKMSYSPTSFEYSYDRLNWSAWTNTKTEELPFGTSGQETLYLCAKCSTGLSSRAFIFSTSAQIAVGGNLLALVNWESLPTTLPNSNCFKETFYNCSAITSVSDTFLTATALTEGCYMRMFYGCTSLQKTPAFTAETMGTECCYGMFSGCTGIMSASNIVIKSVNTFSCECMFGNCKSLRLPPVLSAQTLNLNCYCNMFGNCTALTTSPELPAVTLVDGCYKNMFNGCSSLNEIHCSATDIEADDCTYNWVAGVADIGDFYGKSAAGWTVSADGIPSKWIQHLD